MLFQVQDGDSIDIKSGVDPHGHQLIRRARVLKAESHATKDIVYVRVWRAPFRATLLR